MRSSEGITQLLLDWGNGDQAALEKLMPLVYSELRRLAGNYLRRERAEHTLQPTALVNEAYLKLIDQRNAKWQNRAHFFGISAQLMRRILVDHARQHQAVKRGGSAQQRVSITTVEKLAGAVVSTQCFGYDRLLRLTQAFTNSTVNCSTPTAAGP